jgi:hypothetical protein
LISPYRTGGRRGARGFDLARDAADSAQLTDEDLGLANFILTNGARLYVDHTRPEYSAPECTNRWTPSSGIKRAKDHGGGAGARLARVVRVCGCSVPRTRSRTGSSAAYWSRAPAASPASPARLARLWRVVRVSGCSGWALVLL